MQKLREFLKQEPEAGFTLVELVLSLIITALLAVGVTKVLTVTMQTVAYAQSSTLLSSNVALVDTVLNKDISASNGFVVPDSTSPTKSLLCTSWSTGSTFVAVRPILSLSVPVTVQITSVKRLSSSIEYTVASTDAKNFAVGQLATVNVVSSGSVNSADLGVISAPIASIASGKITVTATPTTADSSAIFVTGTITVNWIHGYEVRKNEINMGELWTLTCDSAGSNNLSNPRLLREDLPLPASTTAWTSTVLCTDKALIDAICTKNTSLTSLTDNPGIKFTIPASTPIKGASRTNKIYTEQAIQGARIIA